MLTSTGLAQNRTRPVFKDTIPRTFDRPGVADYPYLVAPRSLQTEFGFSYSPKFGLSETYFPSVLLRYSPHQRAELRFALNYEPSSIRYIRNNIKQNQDAGAIGTKIRIMDARRTRPAMSVGVNVVYPLQKLRNPHIGLLQTEVVLHFMNNIGPFGINYNVSYWWGGNQMRHTLQYAACFSYTIKQWEPFAEVFGYGTQQGFEPGFDIGLTYCPRPRFQVDISYMRLFSGNEYADMIAAGFSFHIDFGRFKKDREAQDNI